MVVDKTDADLFVGIESLTIWAWSGLGNAPLITLPEAGVVWASKVEHLWLGVAVLAVVSVAWGTFWGWWAGD